MNAAINSPMKYMVSVHGSLAHTTFRVPPGVVLVFMTYPGACLLRIAHHRGISDQSAKNLLAGRAPGYSATYLGGDVVSDYDVDTYDRALNTGVYAIPSMTRVHAFRRPIPIFGRSSTTLSALVATLMRKLPQSPKQPLVLFLAMCRSTDDGESFKRAWNMNARARARLGTSMPDGIRTTAQGTARHIANYTSEYNVLGLNALSRVYGRPGTPEMDRRGVIANAALALHPTRVTREVHPDPKRALRPLLRSRI
jgi:hypothetical protein